MANNTDATVFVTEAAVEAKDSSINTDPVIVIEYNPYKVGYFSMINEGWGEVVSPRLKLQIAPVESYDAFSGALPQHEVGLATFFEKTDVRIESYVPGELRNQRMVAVFGELEYHTESNRPQWLRFRTRVSLVHPGPGATAPPNYTYDLFLEAGRSGYTKNLPVRAYVSDSSSRLLFRTGPRGSRSRLSAIACRWRSSRSREIPIQPGTAWFLVLRAIIARNPARSGAARDLRPCE
jgi:hypothetical protein